MLVRNMNIREMVKIPFLLLSIVVIVMLCSVCLFANSLRLIDLVQRIKTYDCTLPPEGFSQEDLVGKWVAGVPSKKDTLIIREDSTYKQIVHIEYSELPDVDYESDWMPWWLEYTENGIPYLHLQGMRLCGINSDLDCDRPGGSGYDFCKNESIMMNDEGILLALGVPKDMMVSPQGTMPMRGINLWFPAGSENTWVYTLVEP